MKKENFEKSYWIWYWGINDEVEGFQLFFDHLEMKEYSALHSFLSRHISDYWSSYDKIEKP